MVTPNPHECFWHDQETNNWKTGFLHAWLLPSDNRAVAIVQDKTGGSVHQVSYDQVRFSPVPHEDPVKLAVTTADKMQGWPMDLLAEYTDINWVWGVHLKDYREQIREQGYEGFRSFVMCGHHESAPEFIYLFKKAEPHYRGKCLELDLREENTGCHKETNEDGPQPDHH